MPEQAYNSGSYRFQQKRARSALLVEKHANAEKNAPKMPISVKNAPAPLNTVSYEMSGST